MDYSKKGVAFYYIYKALAHPELNGYVTPYTLQERLMHIQEAKRTLGTGIPWLSDTMSNDLKHALGDASNAEFIIDPEGKVIVRRMWSDPAQLRRDLERLVGPVEKPTQVPDLRLETHAPQRGVAVGVVPRLKVPGPMRPLRIQPVPEDSDTPFYVKLRAEVDRDFLERNKGELYLGFHLDPLYQMHWNNLVEPLRFELNPPLEIRVNPLSGKAPEVKEAADADPREFLLELEANRRDEPLQLTVHYFACDNAETFCTPVTQKYRVHLQVDPDGGTVNGRGRPQPPSTPATRLRSGDMIQRLLSRDSDGDGKLSRNELPERMRRRFDFMDLNGDGYLDRQELEAMRSRMRNRRNRRPGAER